MVEDCKSGKEGMLVTSKDLEGFWEMSYVEVKKCDDRFNCLKTLKEKNWIDEDQLNLEQEKKLVRKKLPAKKVVPKKKPNSAVSSLKAHILAERKKLENKDKDGDIEMTENIV